VKGILDNAGRALFGAGSEIATGMGNTLNTVAAPVSQSPWDGFVDIAVGVGTSVGSGFINAVDAAVGVAAPVVESIINFGMDIGKDISNFDINNTDESKVIDSTFFSAYQGQVVIRLDVPGDRSFSFGIMVLDPDTADNRYGAATVQHEYGHYIQLQAMDNDYLRYFATVGLPSMTSQVRGDANYSQPWEYTADMLGGVDPAVRDIDRSPYTYDPYTPNAELEGLNYLNEAINDRFYLDQSFRNLFNK
jgi:hypothetical protein